MDRHTTFRTGGPARYFLVIETRKELAQVLAWLQEEALPWFLLGNGSNLLVGDRGYRGAILHLAGEFLKTEIDEATIRMRRRRDAFRCIEKRDGSRADPDWNLHRESPERLAEQSG